MLAKSVSCEHLSIASFRMRAHPGRSPVTLAEIYSDPRPLLDSRRMFGVDQDFMQPASWKAKVSCLLVSSADCCT